MSQESFSSYHPPIPPTSEETLFSWLRLLRSRRVGPTTFHRLLTEHGSADAALSALPDVAAAAGVEDYQPHTIEATQSELRAGKRAGARLISMLDPAYPKNLAQIDDAPPLLWCMGNTPILQRTMVAMVGARNASSLGTRMAQSLARDLSDAGFVVVSGLARGVDAAAHAASLDKGTIGVLAGGVDVLYPQENSKLAGDMIQSGVRLSEQPMGLQPFARHFPTRNRIISGMAELVIVVEAAAKSGSLITARNALDQGRDVCAVPGHPFDARAAGSNLLLRDGATLIRSATDVIDMLPKPKAPQSQFNFAETAATAPRPKRNLRDIAKLHTLILDRLGPSPLAEDQLIRDLDLDADKVSPAVTDLELNGKVDRNAGGLITRVFKRG